MDSEMQPKASQSWKTKALPVLLGVGLAIAGFAIGGLAGALVVKIAVAVDVPMTTTEQNQCVAIGVLMGFALAPYTFFSVFKSKTW